MTEAERAQMRATGHCMLTIEGLQFEAAAMDGTVKMRKVEKLPGKPVGEVSGVPIYLTTPNKDLSNGS